MTNAPTITKLNELEQKAQTFVSECQAAGFHDVVIVEIIKGAMDAIAISNALKKDESPVFHTREAALSYQAARSQA